MTKWGRRVRWRAYYGSERDVMSIKWSCQSKLKAGTHGNEMCQRRLRTVRSSLGRYHGTVEEGDDLPNRTIEVELHEPLSRNRKRHDAYESRRHLGSLFMAMVRILVPRPLVDPLSLSLGLTLSLLLRRRGGFAAFLLLDPDVTFLLLDADLSLRRGRPGVH